MLFSRRACSPRARGPRRASSPAKQIVWPTRALADDSRQLLEALVQKHLAMHGNDPEKSLAAVSSVSNLKQLENRFAEKRNGKRYIDASAIQTEGGWGKFLWRGTFANHLYALNNYRNDYEHIEAKPFRG